MDKTLQRLRGAALGYAALGWHVFPLRADDGKRPLPNCPSCQRDGGRPHRPADCPCIPRGKTCHGAHAATVDPELINRWWSAEPRGVAVACGPSGLIVIDCDDHGGEPPEQPVPSRPDTLPFRPRTGMEVMRMLASAAGEPNPFSGTATTVTPGGGRQMVFSAPDAMDFRQDSNGKLAWQVDVRSGVTQTTLAPTVRPDGVYRWADPDTTVAPLPDWIRCLMVDSGLHLPTEEAKKPTKTEESRPVMPDRSLVQRLFAREIGYVRGCTSGMTCQLNKSAFLLGKLVGQGAVTYDDTFKRLYDAAFEASRRTGRPFDDFKRRCTIEDALADGMEKAEAEMSETQLT